MRVWLLGAWLATPCAVVVGCAGPGTEVANPVAALAAEATQANRIQASTGRTRVVLLGTGTPSAEPTRWGPATAVVVDDSPYLVDFGPGVVRRAAAAYVNGVAGLAVQNLRIAFLTHLHSDHTVGYPDLILSPWVLGRRAPLVVYGPPGIEAMSRAILEAYREDIRVRVEGAERLDPRGVRVDAHEIETNLGVIYEDDLVTVEAFAVPHGSWERAYGYKFTTVDRTVVISGDTGPFDGLVDIARDADVLVHEAYGSYGFYQRHSGTQRYHGTFHTSASKVGEIAAKANVSMVVLYHQLHLGGESPEQLVEEVREQYDGPVVYGRDLDVF